MEEPIMSERQLSLKDRLVDFLTENPQHLQDIYAEFKDEKPTTIRGRLNENINRCFRRIARGVYLAVKGEAQALIIEGDCWEKIRDIETGSIDAIITDPPYTCLNHHLATGTTRKKANEWSFRTRDIDEELLKEMHRVLKKGGHFFCFLPADSKDTLRYNYNFIRAALKAGFQFNKRFIWDKVAIGMGYNGRNRHEQVVFLSKGKRHKPYDLSVPDVLTHKRIHPSKRSHEAEKPVKLIKDIMRFCSKENDVVLDTFAGSFSTAKAGLQLNRHTISIEIDSSMAQKAARTLRAVSLAV